MKFTKGLLLSAVFAILYCFATEVYAQTELDKFALKPEEWKSANLPTPYGFIASFGYPVFGGPNKNSGFSDRIAFGIDGYYDTWLLGYHQTEHGAGFRISPRSIGRELYNGWYIEVGSRNYLQNYTVTSIDNQNTTAVRKTSASTYMIGYGSMKALSNSSTSLIGGYGIGVGYASGTAGDSFGMAEAEYDVGMRVPIEKKGLNFLLRIYAGLGLPDMDVPVNASSGYSGGSNDPKPHTFFGIKLTALFGLNFDNN
jgi:hypothetical protein